MIVLTAEQQYLNLVNRTVEEGVWVPNPRTGVDCLTVINADIRIDVGNNELPLVTTRKAGIKIPVAELLGYLRGLSNAADFRKLGCKTWDANSNENAAWLNNPHRKGTDDMGRVYGAVGREWRKPEGGSIDLLTNVYNDLRQGIDNRGEIFTFWNPGEFEYGCLRPCMHSHQFSILGDTLHLNSTQRSCDLLLGGVANMVQCFVLLKLMAQITGLKPGFAYHKLVNVHIYRDQYDVLMERGQLDLEPFYPPKLHINPEIKTLEDVLTWVTVDDFLLEDYESHPAIKYPFSV